MAQTPSAGGEPRNDALPGFDVDGALLNLQCDLQTFKEILLSFYRQRKNNYETIAALLSQGDIEKVRDIAHGIKGSSGYLGAWRLHDEAAGLNEACKTGEIKVVEEQLLRFHASFTEVMEGLKNLEQREQ